MKTVRHFVITGRVQGVGFRFYMQRKARELGVTGWVRNRRDSSVEAMVQGESAQVEAMASWAVHGPSSAIVAEIRMTDGTGDYPSFEMLPTE